MKPQYDLEKLRRLAIAALASDDDLSEQLVFKGGNALHFIHGVGKRASLDLDYSMQEDFEDPQRALARITLALERQYSAAGYKVFDVKLTSKPRLKGEDLDPTWGGYELKFKVVAREVHDELAGRLEKLRGHAASGYGDKKDFRIEVSKHEFCDEARLVEFESYELRVYTLAMIGAEKLRALCQQMTEYTRNANSKSARARDFYDICAIEDAACDLTEHPETIRAVFAAKDVPLALLRQIGDYREWHRPDWDAVRLTLRGPHASYDEYVDRVVAIAAALYAIADGS